MKIRKVKKLVKKKFIDKKITLFDDIPIVTWVNNFKPILDFKFNMFGFYYDDSNGTYTNGVLVIKSTITPWHIGYNKNGDIKFRDIKVCKVR